MSAKPLPPPSPEKQAKPKLRLYEVGYQERQYWRFRAVVLAADPKDALKKVFTGQTLHTTQGELGETDERYADEPDVSPADPQNWPVMWPQILAAARKCRRALKRKETRP